MNLMDIKLGENIDGYIIKEIIQKSENSFVGINKDDSIIFLNHINSDLDISRINKKFHKLDAKISRDIPYELFKRIYRELGAALFCAYESESTEEAMKQFETIKNKIDSLKDSNEARLILILTSLILSAGIIFILIRLSLINFLDQKQILICMTFGICGSFFSLLNRNKAVKLNLIGKYRYTLIQSTVIAITGALSALIIYTFSQAGFAFSFAIEDQYTLFAICLASGFSERLIPDLFEQIETKNENKKVEQSP